MDASAFLKGDPSAGRQTPSLQLSRFIGFTPGPRPESAWPKQTQSDSASRFRKAHAICSASGPALSVDLVSSIALVFVSASCFEALTCELSLSVFFRL